MKNERRSWDTSEIATPLKKHADFIKNLLEIKEGGLGALNERVLHAIIEEGLRGNRNKAEAILKQKHLVEGLSHTADPLPSNIAENIIDITSQYFEENKETIEKDLGILQRKQPLAESLERVESKTYSSNIENKASENRPDKQGPAIESMLQPEVNDIISTAMPEQPKGKRDRQLEFGNDQIHFYRTQLKEDVRENRENPTDTAAKDAFEAFNADPYTWTMAELLNETKRLNNLPQDEKTADEKKQLEYLKKRLDDVSYAFKKHLLETLHKGQKINLIEKGIKRSYRIDGVENGIVGYYQDDNQRIMKNPITKMEAFLLDPNIRIDVYPKEKEARAHEDNDSIKTEDALPAEQQKSKKEELSIEEQRKAIKTKWEQERVGYYFYKLQYRHLSELEDAKTTQEGLTALGKMLPDSRDLPSADLILKVNKWLLGKKDMEGFRYNSWKGFKEFIDAISSHLRKIEREDMKEIDDKYKKELNEFDKKHQRAVVPPAPMVELKSDVPEVENENGSETATEAVVPGVLEQQNKEEKSATELGRLLKDFVDGEKRIQEIKKQLEEERERNLEKHLRTLPPEQVLEFKLWLAKEKERLLSEDN